MNETERRREARRRLWAEACQGLDLAGKTVLDAGTGEGHLTRFLAEQRPGRLVSITCCEDELPQARAALGAYAESVQFVIADVTAMGEIADASFDLVMADFLIAAVSAFRPYREFECVRELARILRPGGRLILTGWEIWPECRGRTEQTLRELFKLRDAMHHLRGAESYREHPRFWIENRLAELAMPVERAVTVPDIHFDVSWLVKNVRSVLMSLPAGPVRSALADRLEELASELAGASAFQAGLEFGRLYAVIAMKLVPGYLVIDRP